MQACRLLGQSRQNLRSYVIGKPQDMLPVVYIWFRRILLKNILILSDFEGRLDPKPHFLTPACARIAKKEHWLIEALGCPIEGGGFGACSQQQSY